MRKCQIQYISEDHRASLIVKCIRNRRNMVEDIQRMVNEALGDHGGEGKSKNEESSAGGAQDVQ